MCFHFMVTYAVAQTCKLILTTKTPTPVYIQPYKTRWDVKNKIDDSLDKLVKMNVLKKGLTDYASLIILQQEQ